MCFHELLQLRLCFSYGTPLVPADVPGVGASVGEFVFAVLADCHCLAHFVDAHIYYLAVGYIQCNSRLYYTINAISSNSEILKEKF